MNFSRLFDLPDYQRQVNALDDMLASKQNGKWTKYATKQVINTVNQLSIALLEINIQPGDMIALVSDGRPEWNIIDFAIQQTGAIVVPIYPTISVSEYSYIFKDANIKYAFVETADLFNKIKTVGADCSSLVDIFTIEPIKDAKHWKTLINTQIDKNDLSLLEGRKGTIKANDLATILYTSGTTGNPKGVMLSHQNIISNIKATISIVPFELGQRAFSFLPLSHIFERMVTYCYMAAGSPIYYATNLDSIGEELKEVKPFFFSAVPRLLEKVYESILTKGESLTGFKKTLFDWSIKLANNYTEQDENSLQLKIARWLVFKKWKDALGGNVLGIVTGAAALNPVLGKIFTAAGIVIREGYGLTETAPVISSNRFEPGGFKFGTVGLPIPGVEVKLADDGEICIKGPNVMLGYYNLPEETSKAIDEEGWFHTGDIGCWEDNRFLKITDRKKALFKTSGGKYVAPQVIENKLKESPLIEQVMVLGNNRKFVSALIVPNKKLLHSNFSNDARVIKNIDVREKIEAVIEEKNAFFGQTEKVKKFVILNNEWTIDSGELTPSMKVKRKIVAENNKYIIEGMYE